MPPPRRRDVHLHVGDLAGGVRLLCQRLRLNTTVWHYPGAPFFAASGHHHHLGVNTWAGRGAQPPTEADAQLLEWTIELPDAAALATLADSLARAGRPVECLGQVGAEPARSPRIRGGLAFECGSLKQNRGGHHLVMSAMRDPHFGRGRH